jgi:hypothetical protein
MTLARIEEEGITMGSQKQRWLIAATLLGAFVLCSALMAQQSQKPLTHDDVAKMVKGGVPESVIISAVRTGPSNFDLSPDALIRRCKYGQDSVPWRSRFTGTRYALQTKEWPATQTWKRKEDHAKQSGHGGPADLQCYFWPRPGNFPGGS